MGNHHPPSDLLHARRVTEAGHRSEQSVVAAGLQDEHPRVRIAAAGAAHRMGMMDESLLVRLLNDGEAAVRCRAAELAARHRACDHLVRALVHACDDEWRVAEMSAFALGELGDASPQVVKTLEEMARHHHDALCREAAVAALGALGAGRDAILAALDDRAVVRRRAVIALASFDGPDIDSALQKAANDRDWQVRQAAEDLLTPER